MGTNFKIEHCENTKSKNQGHKKGEEFHSKVLIHLKNNSRNFS